MGAGLWAAGKGNESERARQNRVGETCFSDSQSVTKRVPSSGTFCIEGSVKKVCYLVEPLLPGRARKTPRRPQLVFGVAL